MRVSTHSPRDACPSTDQGPPYHDPLTRRSRIQHRLCHAGTAHPDPLVAEMGTHGLGQGLGPRPLGTGEGGPGLHFLPAPRRHQHGVDSHAQRGQVWDQLGQLVEPMANVCVCVCVCVCV